MIKIIKHGTRDTRECEKCGCLFSFDEEDILGGHGLRKHIECPQCRHDLTLKMTKNTNADTPFDNLEMRNCSNCKRRFTTENKICNSCGSYNDFKYWEDKR